MFLEPKYRKGTAPTNDVRMEEWNKNFEKRKIYVLHP